MAYKIQIENNFFVVIDTGTSAEIIREVRDQVKFAVSTTIYKFKWNYANGPDVSNQSVTEFDFSNIVDSSGIAFASQAVLNAFLSANIGHINDLDVPIVIDETIIDNGTNSTLLRNEGGVVGDTDYTVPKTDGTANQVLQTNGAGVVTWQTLATGITIGTTPITSGVAGRVLFEGSGNVIQEDSSLFWDNTNKRLGIGAIPATNARLDVRAQGALSTDIAFRVRNSADTLNIIQVNGRGDAFIGQGAGRLTTGLFNTFVGIQAGFNNITGTENTAIGVNAGFGNLSSFNTYLGSSAGANGTTATGCLFLGYAAGQNSNAQYGVFIGYAASTAGGNGTVAIGYSAGAGTGIHNLSLGQSSGLGMTTGSFNTHLGYRSVGSGVTTGNYNNLLGSDIVVGNVSNNAVLADNQGNQAIRKDANHNVLLGREIALATNATNGFAYFPTCAGIPTGVPAASFTGKAPIVIDSTNNKMYIYTNAAWVALN